MKCLKIQIFGTIAATLLSLTGCNNENKKTCEHSYGPWTITAVAKCESDGLKERTCNKCGNKETETINKLGHSFTNYQSDGNATCTEDGTKTARCDHEGCVKTDTREDTDSRLGHSFTNYIYNNDATCTEDGTETATCDHLGCNLTDTRAKIDSRLGHSFTNFIYNNDETCLTDGTETAHCDHEGCSETLTRAVENTKGHIFTQFVYNNDATCINDGTETAICDREDCSETLTRTASNTKLGHSFKNYTSNDDATCEHKATKTAKCERCEEKSTVEDKKSIFAHKCTQNADLLTATCSLCGKTENVFEYSPVGPYQYIDKITEMGKCLEELSFSNKMVLYPSIEYVSCLNLKKLNIDNLEGYFDFDSFAFNDMLNLEEIVLNIPLRNLPSHSLSNLPKLKTVTFGGLDLSGSLGYNALLKLPSLETIYTNTTIANWYSVRKYDGWFDDSVKNTKIVCVDGVLDMYGNRIPE